MNNNIFIYILLIIMTILGAFGGFFFKKSTENIKSIIFCKELYVGGVLYFISALLNIYILKFLPYVIVLPMTGITYIWTLLISYRFLKEKITRNKKIGILLIILGASIVSI